jgi:hypothetical protein
LTLAQLGPVVREAEALWLQTGLSPAQRAALEGVQASIADLPAGFVAMTSGSEIWIDARAAGYGWFADPMPMNRRAFTRLDGEFVALRTGRAWGRMDLLTVVAHELGHVLGLPDEADADDPNGLMAVTLAAGVRRLPASASGLVSSPRPPSRLAFGPGALAPAGPVRLAPAEALRFAPQPLAYHTDNARHTSSNPFPAARLRPPQGAEAGLPAGPGIWATRRASSGGNLLRRKP